VTQQLSQLTVETKHVSYPIFIGRDLGNLVREQIAELEASGSKVAVVTDCSLEAAQHSFIEEVFRGLPIHAVDSGETSKSLTEFGKTIDFLAASKLDRGGVVIAFGGGVVGDLGGFAAASYLRGIRFIQMPTTLLSMVDSSVGGKTGINISAGKNLLGAFHQPIAVYSDLDRMETLPPREFAAGMAEVIKHGMLADRELFELLESQALSAWNDSRIASVVERNCSIKAGVVNADEKEISKSGGRALLNLGHTFGHAIENVAGYGEYLHGEAIAIGLVAAAKLSRRLNLISDGDVERIQKTVAAHELPIALNRPLSAAALLEAMQRDKKTRSGAVRFVVMNGIGNAETCDGVSTDHALAIMRELGASD